jgi:hypothetical protein
MKNTSKHICDKTTFVGWPSTESRRITSFHNFLSFNHYFIKYLKLVCKKNVVMVTDHRLMFLIFTCMLFWVWEFLRRWFACAPTACEVVHDFRNFEKHWYGLYARRRSSIIIWNCYINAFNPSCVTGGYVCDITVTETSRVYSSINYIEGIFHVNFEPYACNSEYRSHGLKGLWDIYGNFQVNYELYVAKGLLITLKELINFLFGELSLVQVWFYFNQWAQNIDFLVSLICAWSGSRIQLPKRCNFITV